MNEAARFVRYVFPGLSSLFFFVLFCLLSNPDRVEGWLENVSGDVAAPIGAAIAVFVASGAIGYLLSVGHHFLYWLVYVRIPAIGLFADLRHTLIDAHKRGEVVFIEQASGNALSSDVVGKISVDGAWILVNSIWHFRRGDVTGLDSAEHRSATLFDIMHSAGALFAGHILATIIWAIVEFRSDWTLSSTFVLGFAGLLCAALAYNLHLTAHRAPTFTGNVLSNYLAGRKQKEKQALQVIADRALFGK